MLKQPRAGRVKTRLGADIGMIPAVWWFRHQTRALVTRLERDRRWQTVLSVAPDTAVGALDWPAQVPRMAQGRGTVGARMARAFQGLPPGPAVLIGGDIPAVAPAHIAHAFATLGNHDVCFGPAEDGGFWLIGVRRPQMFQSGIFDAVRWSGPHALDDTLKNLRGRKVAFVDRLRDVDCQEDLRRAGDQRQSMSIFAKEKARFSA